MNPEEAARVLAAIDAETAKCICGSPIRADGESLDYCSAACQTRYTHLGYDGPHELDQTSDRWPVKPQLTSWSAVALESLGIEPAPPDADHILETSNPTGSRAPYLLARDRLMAVPEEGPRLYWVPEIADPAAPTAAELDAGIEIDTTSAGETITIRPDTSDDRPVVVGFDGSGRAATVTYDSATGYIIIDEARHYTSGDLQAFADRIDADARAFANADPEELHRDYLIETLTANQYPTIREGLEAYEAPVAREAARRTAAFADALTEAFRLIEDTMRASADGFTALGRAATAPTALDSNEAHHAQRVYQLLEETHLRCDCGAPLGDFGPGATDTELDEAFAEHILEQTGMDVTAYFRQRALESRQNRNTGPAPKRHRRPRDHGNWRNHR
ncbi:hypothetical protein GCM10028833_32300 [Glycomyces tarimensis]